MPGKNRSASKPTLESVERRELAAAHVTAAALPIPHDGASTAAEIAGLHTEVRRPKGGQQAPSFVAYTALTLPNTGAQNVLNFLLTREPYAGKQPTREILYKGQTKFFLTADGSGAHSFVINTYAPASITPPAPYWSSTPTRVPNFDFVYLGSGNNFQLVLDPNRPYVVYPPGRPRPR